MIKETLPTLPEDHFNEVVLYQQYVSDSLKRKALDLQPAQRLLGPERLIENLTSILEELAVRLHMSHGDYVNLRAFRTDRRENLAELLWTMSGASSEELVSGSPDARSRVGIRSLLKPVAGVDPDLWPVDFFHRSMREFFVARALIAAVEAQSDKAKSILAQLPLQPEIVNFARLLMVSPMHATSTERQETYTYKLVSLAKSAILPIYRDQHLGGNALTLLFALNRKIPKTDWSELALDYADLAGANLNDLCFRGSSLRHASLDNASLVGTDLRYADLTGVQLEQTAPVLAVTFDTDSNTAYAAYGDSSVRRWTFGVGGRMSCVTLAELDFQPSRLDMTPFGDVIVKGESEIAILSVQGYEEEWHIVSRFATVREIDALSIRDGMIILPGPNQTLERYDPGQRRLMTTASVAPGSHLLFIGEATTLAGADEHVHLNRGPDSWAFRVPKLTSLDARMIDDDHAVLALGHEDGTVSLWHVTSIRSNPQIEGLWQRPAHAGSVNTVHLSGLYVLSGGMDRTICLFTLTDNWSTGEPLRLHRTLDCANMMIEGVQGPREQSLLESLLHSTPHTAGSVNAR
jgi:hypothetical protein